MEQEKQDLKNGMWSETKYPDPADRLPPDELKFVDPLDRIGSPRSGTKPPSAATASAVSGILTVLTCVLKPVPLFLGALAIALGIYAYGKEPAARKAAKIGIVTGIAGCAVCIGIMLFPLLFKLLDGVAGGLAPKTEGL